MADTQIWLKPQPKHIDENFDNFLQYLKENGSTNDVLYNESVRLLKERVNLHLEERFAKSSFDFDVNQATFNARLCAAFLLIHKNSPNYTLVVLTLTNHLITLSLEPHSAIKNNQNYATSRLFDLCWLAARLIHKEIPSSLSFSWDDIIDFSLDLFVHKFLGAYAELTNFLSPHKFVGRGIIETKNDNLILCPYLDKAKANVGYSVLSLLNNGVISIATPKNWSVRESHWNDIRKMSIFVEDYIAEVKKLNADPSKKYKQYEDGDEMAVVITSMSNGHIKVKTLDPAYTTLEKELVIEDANFIFEKVYKKELWIDTLTVGKKINVRYYKDDQEFSILVPLCDHIKRWTESHKEVYACFNKLPYWTCKDNVYTNYPVWTADGYCININIPKEQYNELEDNYIISVSIDSFDSSDDYYGCIRGSFKSLAYSDINIIREVVCPKMMKGFFNQDLIPFDEMSSDSQEIDVRCIKELCTALVRVQGHEENALTRYRIISAARIISYIADFSVNIEWLDYWSNYIKFLINFAQANDYDEYANLTVVETPDNLAGSDIIKRSYDIMRILSCFAKDYDESSEILDPYIEVDDTDTSRLASLVQSYNRLVSVLDGKTLRGIKREILNSLSIVSQGESNLDLSTDIMGVFGDEDNTKEFKSSFFHAPADAAEQRQFINVFRGICAMMNAQGGTLYLGVNDFGQPLGLQEDIEQVKKLHNMFGIDGLMRYINKRGEECFGETVWSYVSMKPISEYNIILFQIQPYPYDIVTLEKVAFLRKNNSSAPIKDDKTKEDIRRRRQENLRNCNDKLINLKDAMQRELQVYLKDYSSSNSGKISDRLVEPFAFDTDEYVICYEPSSDACKSFRLSRIGSVRLTDKPFEHKAQHTKPQFDAFHMSGEKDMTLRLRLGLRAKNAIGEQYPSLKDIIYAEGNHWILNTVVYSMTPIAHFYLNYAEDIEILEANGMMEIVEDYVYKNIIKK